MRLTTKTSRTVLALLAPALTAALVASAAIRVTAEKHNSGGASGLDVPVTLNIGRTTLADVCSLLSKQTGLAIQPASYLVERRLTVHLQNLTARQALDSLAELNGWNWAVNSDGRIVIERPRARRARNFPELGSLLAGSLPLDLTRFLGIGVEPKDYLKPRKPNSFNYDDPAVELQDQIQAKIRAIIKERQIEHFEQLKPGILDGKPRRVTELTPDQRARLAELLCLYTLENLNMDLLQGRMKPYERNPEDARISIAPIDQIAVSYTTQDGNIRKRSGFAVPLEEPKPIPES